MEKGLIAGEVAQREKDGESEGDGVFWWIEPPDRRRSLLRGRVQRHSFRAMVALQWLSARTTSRRPIPNIDAQSIATGGKLDPAPDPIEKDLTFPGGSTAGLLDPKKDRRQLRIHPHTGRA